MSEHNVHQFQGGVRGVVRSLKDLFQGFKVAGTGSAHQQELNHTFNLIYTQLGDEYPPSPHPGVPTRLGWAAS